MFLCFNEKLKMPVNYEFKLRNRDGSIPLDERGYAIGTSINLEVIDREVSTMMNQRYSATNYSIGFLILESCGIYCTGNASREGDFDMNRFNNYLRERVHTSKDEEGREEDRKLERVLRHFLLEKYYFVAWR